MHDLDCKLLNSDHSRAVADRERAEDGHGVTPLVWLREIVVITVVKIPHLLTAACLIIQVFWIPSPRCVTRWWRDDRIAVSPCRCASIVNIHRGDVVVFDDMLGWLGPTEITSPSAIRKIGGVHRLRPCRWRESRPCEACYRCRWRSRDVSGAPQARSASTVLRSSEPYIANGRCPAVSVRSMSPFPGGGICRSREITVPTPPTRAITWVRASPLRPCLLGRWHGSGRH